MKAILALLVFPVITFNLSAQIGNVGVKAREKAKVMSNQNANRLLEPGQPAPQAQPGQPAQQRPGQPAVAPAAKAAPAPFQAQPQMVSKIADDLAAIMGKPQASAEQKQQLAKDLAASVQGTAKPSAEAVNKLTEGIATTLAGKKLSGTEHQQLARHLTVVMNTGAAAQPGEVQSSFNSATTVLKIMGVTGAANEKLAGDLQAFIGEAQKGIKPTAAR